MKFPNPGIINPNLFNSKNFLWAVLITVLLAGTAVRFYKLDFQSLKNDEITSWYMSNKQTLSKVFTDVINSDVYPPGYHVIVYFTEKVLGDSEKALRLPSAVAGSISILIMFLLGSKLYSYKEGLLASALIAFLHLPIYYSQEARAYSLLLLFSLVSSYFGVLLIKSTFEKTRSLYTIAVCYVLSSIITSYLHYFGLFFILLQGFMVLLYFKQVSNIKFILKTYSCVLLAYLFWLPYMLFQLRHNLTYISDLYDPVFLDYFLFLRAAFNNSTKVLMFILPIYLFFFIKIIFRIKKTKIEDFFLSTDFFLFLWAGLPFSIIYAKSEITSPLFTYSLLIISLPGIYLLFARSITTFIKNIKINIIFQTALICLFLYQLIFIKGYYTYPNRPQWRQSAQFLMENIHAYKNSLVIRYSWSPFLFNYYFRNSDLSKETIEWTNENDPSYEKISKIISEKKIEYVWLFRVDKPIDLNLLNSLKDHFKLLEYRKFFKSEIWLFRSKTK
ncbi:MAG: glycosyltransferase family 39 protein [Elusimicrobia bacterium]|nr:glycosyltransferase family 39 protein [Candidatus Liberimonas magnetica]